MNTYFACIQFVSSVGDDEDTKSLCEDSIRLIRAADKDEATARAIELGKSEEHSYKNEDGNNVRWKFSQLIDIQEFCDPSLSDGVEVYSRLHRNS